MAPNHLYKKQRMYKVLSNCLYMNFIKTHGAQSYTYPY